MPNYAYQCQLRCANSVTVTWVPEAWTEVGNVLALDYDPRAWTIAEVWDAVDRNKVFVSVGAKKLLQGV